MSWGQPLPSACYEVTKKRGVGGVVGCGADAGEMAGPCTRQARTARPPHSRSWVPRMAVATRTSWKSLPQSGKLTIKAPKENPGAYRGGEEAKTTPSSTACSTTAKSSRSSAVVNAGQAPPCSPTSSCPARTRPSPSHKAP